MKAMRKSRVHLSVAAALVGLASINVVDAQDRLGAITNTGQALVFPYYTVNNGWVTTFNVMNTSDDTVAVKVRFHESKNSRDVLDFNIVMSPYDAWTAWLQDSDAGPQLFTTDASCTSPLNVNGANASAVAYTGSFDDGGGTGRNRMREGYVEMLVMGISDAGNEDLTTTAGPTFPVPYNAKHVDGVPRDCAAVDADFVANVDAWKPGNTAADLPTSYVPAAPVCAAPRGYGIEPEPGSGFPDAACDFRGPAIEEMPLKGNVSWLHAGTGTGAGTEAIAVQPWNTLNYVTAQQFPWFLEPTFASGADGGLWTVQNVLFFEAQIQFSAVLNEWANNPVNGAATDWVVTFPTKAYHVDKFNDQIQAAVSKYRNAAAFPTHAVVTNDGAPAAPTDPAATACNATRSVCQDVGAPTTLVPFEWLFNVQGDGDSKITVSYTVYDREEGEVAGDSTSISPAPPGEFPSLRFESNVLQFGSEPVVDSPNAEVIDASTELGGAPNGWAQGAFELPLPVTAFAIKERNRGEAGTNYGQAMDHGFVLPVNGTPAP